MLEFNEEKHEYLLDGVALPSVTTILSETIFESKYEGVDEETLKKAAEKGTYIHQEIQDYVEKGEIGFTEELGNFIEIVKSNNLTNIKSETMTTNKEIAGTIDIIATMGEKRILADIKTTYKLDREYVSWQLSIYADIYEEETGEKIDELYAIWLRDDEYKFQKVERKSKEDISNVLISFKTGAKIDFITTDLQTIPQEKQTLFINSLVQIKNMEKSIDAIKQMILEEMEQRGVYNIDLGKVLISYKPSYEKTSVDSKKLKEDGIYEKYSKKSKVKSSIVIKVKEE